MQKNASLLAIVAVDTAENEPSKVGDGDAAFGRTEPAFSERIRSTDGPTEEQRGADCDSAGL